ncbi:tetratricopeptide repeat protein [Cohnella boryungensis]|uniref:Tetratricopeptide repeat protein n=1 Tax=Cohnella boryungensis TaxID=768479 RepID=A0ABV8S8V0_9BACL
MNGDACLQQAYDAILQGDFEAAIRWFGQAISLEPDNADYYYRGSITCARSGKTSLAMSYARKAAELNPDEPSYRLHLCALLSRERIALAKQWLHLPEPDNGAVVAILKEAIQLDPLAAEAKLLLGIAYRAERSYRQALEALRDALQLEPGWEEAKRLLSEIRTERRSLLKQQYSQYYSKRNR